VIPGRVAAVRERIARAAERAGRRPEDVTLVAVSKTHPAERVAAAFAAGLRDFGENKVQEAEQKAGPLRDLTPQGLRWHLIGHLQSNKAKKAAQIFDLVHSVDSAEIARKLEHYAATLGKTLDVLVQVDLAGEETKHGADEAHLFPLLEILRGMKALRPRGLMVLPPLLDDPEALRPYFRRLRELRDKALAKDLLLGGELSMGMSHDFEVAIEEGATLVRVGTALFGERERK
jgi:pyridoxal phosphate enzyme (YggS family)